MTTEQSDCLEFMHRMCFPPFKLYLELRETLLNNICAVKMQPMARVPTIAGQKTDEYISLRSKSFHYTSLCFSNNILDAFSWQCCQTAQQKLVRSFDYIAINVTYWTLQFDWRAAQSVLTNQCMAVLPDPALLDFSERRVGTRLGLVLEL